MVKKTNILKKKNTQVFPVFSFRSNSDFLYLHTTLNSHADSKGIKLVKDGTSDCEHVMQVVRIAELHGSRSDTAS